MEAKRSRKVTDKFAFADDGYVLLLFDDSSYEILHSNSSLFSHETKYSDLREKQKITLRPGFNAVILMKSVDKYDLEVYKNRLIKRLDRGNIDLNDSFGFLKSSTDESFEPESDSESDCDENVANKENDSENDRTHDSKVSSLPEKNDQMQNLILLELKKQNSLQQVQITLQKKILSEMKSMKKIIKSPLETKPKVNPTPVMYSNVDIASLGSRNLDPSQFGVLLGRHLFSDAELEAKMLFPQRSSSRPPLSPTRSNLFLEAVTSRFNKEAVVEAVRAVNCLGNDLKKGRRKRNDSFVAK